MDSKSQNKQDQLQVIIEELSISQDTLKNESIRKDYKERFESIYCDGFRHSYSKIFGVITRVDNSPNQNTEILLQNIELLGQYIHEHSKEEVCRGFKKFKDHISLDLANINHLKGIQEHNIHKIKGVQHSNEQLKQDLENMQRNNEQLKQDLDQSKNEYVTILGIFASIVLSFVSGMLLSTSVLENMHKISIYRLMFAIVALGYIIIILIYMLIKLVYNILNYNKYLKGFMKDGEKPLLDIKKLSIIFAKLILLIFLLWFIDIVNIRNFCQTKILG